MCPLLVRLRMKTRITLSDDNEGLDGGIMEDGTNLEDIAAYNNVQRDVMDNVLSAKLEITVHHRYLSGIIELHVKYINGDLSWHPMDLIKDKKRLCWCLCSKQ